MMFDFLMQGSLQKSDFNQRVEFLIPGFLPKNLITLIYADGGMGKTWLSLAIAKMLSGHQRVIYLDFDNPLSILKERGVEHKLVGLDNLYYVQRSKSKLTAPEMLDALEAKAAAGEYKDTVIIVDSLRNFVDVMNDNKAMCVMEQFMNLREAGATIVILSHANKDGKNYQGSNNIRNSLDNMYRLVKIESPEGEVRFVLTVKKERAAIVDVAFKVRTCDFMLQPIDVESARMNAEEKDFVTSVQQAIKAEPGINKKLLLSTLGFKEDDKTARGKLDQYEGVYWQSSKIKNTYCYQLIVDPASSTSSTSAAV